MMKPPPRKTLVLPISLNSQRGSYIAQFVLPIDLHRHEYVKLRKLLRSLVVNWSTL